MSIRENIVALGYLAVPSGWIVLLAVLDLVWTKLSTHSPLSEIVPDSGGR